LGYSERELADLQTTIEKAAIDVVIGGTPCDLSRLLKIRTPIVRARYEFEDVNAPYLSDVVTDFIKNRGIAAKDTH
jgi:predicted GTPase